ncbi:MAG: metal-dependent transcriptional regulator [Lentisphaerae bacterium]|nr:metal-dependent transcriptional regulator [Lentisphaerota bacterium]
MMNLNHNVEETLEQCYVRQVEKGPAEGGTDLSLADEDIREAAALGLLERSGADVRLTEAGREAGRDVVRRHRLAECLLRDVLGVRTEELNAGACEFEHIIRRGLDEKICVLLGHPKACPHGKAIPPGECCLKAREDEVREVKPLCDGKADEAGVVAYLSTRDNREVQKLMAMGVLPGTPIRLTCRYPSYVFEIGLSQFTVDRELAEKIIVHWK